MSESVDRGLNKDKTEQRKRQWQTVGESSDDDNSNSNNTSDSDSDSRSEDDHKHTHKHHKDKDERKHKKSKKEKKDNKKHKDHKDSKKDKKDKKDKKHKKHKHDKSNNTVSKSIDQNNYGKYGIIREEHFFQKQREFEVYMAEVKGVHGVMAESKRDIMVHFKSFMEDYNTATMPHDKYYSYEAWEMRDYQMRQQQEQQSNSSRGKDDTSLEYFRNDEEVVRQERKRRKENEENQAMAAVKARLSTDKTAIENMKLQSQVTLEMQMAFKRGDMATVQRLERALTPAVKSDVKHPWA